MKVTSVSTAKKVDDRPKYKQEYIPSSSCCGRCLYNLPAGVCLMLLPAVSLLVIGATLVVIEHEDGSWKEGILQAGIMFTAAGGVLFLLSLIYWLTQYRKLKPSRDKAQDSKSRRASPSKLPTQQQAGGVELVGVYRISGQENFAYASSTEHLSSPNLRTVQEMPASSSVT